MKEISRRDFIKGAAASALSVAAIGKLGGLSAPASAAETSVKEPDAQFAALEKIPAAYLNPQRTDYRTADKELKTLFSPLKIGKVELSHRMVKSAAGSACYLSGKSDEFIEYYVQLAKGGLELIFVETVDFLEVPADTGEYDAETKAYLERLIGECAKYGASLGYQVSGFGMG